MRFCENCGRQISDNSKFCPGCGTPVSAKSGQAAGGGSVSPASMSRNVQTKKKPNPAGPDKKTPGIIIGVIAVAVVAAVLLLLLVVFPSLGRRGGDDKGDVGVEEELETVDVFDGISMTYSGYDTECEISLVYDSPDERLDRLTASDFEVSPSTGISNGDIVTVTITDEAIDYLADSLGLAPRITSKDYIVDGIEEYDDGGDALVEDEEFSSGNDVSEDDGIEDEEIEDEEIEDIEEPEQVEEEAASEYLCPYSSERLITLADLEDIRNSGYGALPADKSLEQMIINEIYAKHGYLFKTDEIQEYFEQKSWYQAIGYYTSDSDEVMSMMSEIEKDNIDFLKTFR